MSDDPASADHDDEAPETSADDEAPETTDGPDDEPTSERSPDRRNPARLAWIGAGVAVAVGLGSFVYATGTSAPSEAVVSMALDEREVGWPFYGAAQEKAVVFFADDELVERVAAEIGSTELDSIELRTPGDLSLLEVAASADDQDTALAAADTAAEQLLTWSQDEQRSLLDDERFLAAELVDDLDVAVAELEADLAAAADDEGTRIQLEAELATRSTERTEAQLALEEIDRTIEVTGAEFRILAPAEAIPHRVPTLLSSLATGLGAGVLAILAVPILSRRR